MNFFRTSNFPYGEVSEEKAQALIQSCCNPQITSNVLIGWEEDGTLQGILAGQITEVLFNYNKVATELIWWVEPGYRKGRAGPSLLGAYRYWAEFNGCKFIQMVGLQNDYAPALDRYYKKQGFHLSESTYIKEI